MSENNQMTNKVANDLDKTKQNENVNYISFSEIDKNGKFIETYGYFKKNESNLLLDESLGEIVKKIGKKQGGTDDMNREKYLPIGSLVLLKEAKKRVMIIGFMASANETGDKVFDYMGCMYPEGVLSSDQTLVFNHDQISEIYYMGYSDNEEKEFKEKLKELENN